MVESCPRSRVNPRRNPAAILFADRRNVNNILGLKRRQRLDNTPCRGDVVTPRKGAVFTPREEEVAPPRKGVVFAPREDDVVPPRKGAVFTRREDDICTPRKDAAFTPYGGDVVTPRRKDSTFTPRRGKKLLLHGHSVAEVTPRKHDDDDDAVASCKNTVVSSREKAVSFGVIENLSAKLSFGASANGASTDGFFENRLAGAGRQSFAGL